MRVVVKKAIGATGCPWDCILFVHIVNLLYIDIN